MDKLQVSDIKNALKKIFSEMEPGEKFYGYEIANRVKALYPAHSKTYTDTILRQMRLYCHGKYRTVIANKSLYERV